MRIRKAQAANYTTVTNSIINSPDLSAKAKGVYLYLFSKPDDWIFSEERITRDFTDGLHSIRTAIKDLIKLGLLQRIRYAPTKDIAGKFTSEVEYIIHQEIPTCENPTLGKSHDIVKKEYLQKKERNSKSSNVHSMYSIFNSCKKDKAAQKQYLNFCNYTIIHDSKWKEKHAPMRNATIKEYESFLLEMQYYGIINYFQIADYMVEFQEVETKSDRHFPVFCHWLYSQVADDDYRGFTAQGDKMSVDEMIEWMKETS